MINRLKYALSLRYWMQGAKQRYAQVDPVVYNPNPSPTYLTITRFINTASSDQLNTVPKMIESFAKSNKHMHFEILDLKRTLENRKIMEGVE